MSHWTRLRVKILNPNRDLLRRALEVLAERLNAVLAENATVHGFRRSELCDFALLMQLPYGNGYGVKITEGGVEVVADDHGAPLKAREVADLITQYYVAIALVYAANQLGFTVASATEAKEALIIDLVR